MTNAKHTPGPWSRNIKPAHKYVTVWSGRNTHVAYVATGAPLSNDEIEANIRLIAAAPELLEALKALRAAVVEYEDDDDLDAAKYGADDAIAKAEGVQ